MSEAHADADPLESAADDVLERHGPKLALTLVALGLVLRLRRLDEYWLNPDEGIYYSTLTWAEFGDFWAEVMANAHPPAFYLLIRSASLLTWDFVWLRATALAFGVAAIWAFWLVGRELGGRGRAGTVAGLVSAGLLAVSGEAIALSQVIRPYMFLLALLAGSLFHLLKYRSDPTPRRLVAYIVLLSLALLTHYSAVLAMGVFVAVVALYHGERVLERRAWERLALAHLVPGALFAVLFLQHLDSALTSGPMIGALAPGGWLSDWLVASPSEAWRSFVTFQIFILPPDFQGRSALLLLGAAAVAIASRTSLVAVLLTSALAIALGASAAGLYPFGPSRHDTWLVLFTLPALGWLAGRLVEQGARASYAGAATLTLLLLVGGPLEQALGAYPLRTNATEEQVIRAQDLAPLVVGRMDPQAEPRIVLMSFQTYNLLMPLYASDRQRLTPSSRIDLFSFPYGARQVVVSGQWDWNDLDDVREVVRTMPERLPEVASVPPARVLLLAGGWGSGMFGAVPELQRRDAVGDFTGILGADPAGRPILRLAAFVLDMEKVGLASP